MTDRGDKPFRGDVYEWRDEGLDFELLHSGLYPEIVYI